MHILLSLSLHFYLLYLLLNSCDGNDGNTSDLKQCLIDTWGYVSQNVRNEAVVQLKKWLREGVKDTLKNKIKLK